MQNSLTETSSPSTPALAISQTLWTLAHAGLLPFILLPLIHLAAPADAVAGVTAMDLLAGYSLAIACFMAGTLWRPGAPDALLITSNLLTLAAVVLVVWRPLIWLPGLALIFALIAWAERRWVPLPPDYRALRQRLTWVVKISLLISFVLAIGYPS